MRTYILALTKYGIAGIVIAYTLVAFFLLLKNQDRDIEMRRALSSAELVLMLAFQILSYFTLFVALDNVRYILLCLAHTVVFLGVNLLYQNTFRHAHMPLFNNMCMLISAGIIILSRLDITRALKQFVMVCAGFVIAFALPFFRKKFYLLKKPGYIYAVLGVGALSIVMLLGATTLGANITYTIFGLTFQPSEFVKILYLLFLASTLRNVQDLKELAVITAFAAAHVLVLIGSRDLGSGLIFYMVFIFMAYMALDEWIILAGGFGAMALASVVLYHFFSHIQQRVQAFLDPWSLIDSIGYQITQALFAIGAGGPFGAGLGQGQPDKIPFVESDFIFAAVCEEFGIIIGICVVLLCVNCFMNMLSLSMTFADRFYRLLAFGSAVVYGFQAFLTLGGQTKFIPLTGVTLPLVSYGGSSILSTLILFTGIETMYMLRADKIEQRKRLERRRLAGSSRYSSNRQYRRQMPDLPDSRLTGGDRRDYRRYDAVSRRRYGD